jgi:hypothetical protein
MEPDFFLLCKSSPPQSSHRFFRDGLVRNTVSGVLRDAGLVLLTASAVRPLTSSSMTNTSAVEPGPLPVLACELAACPPEGG